jgi:hypothetical protein
VSSTRETNGTCGCCKGIKTLTPGVLDNLPGLSALAYRVGTHGSFKTTMLAALSGQRTLDGLTIRDDNDPSIALIDTWACVLDVLTFYQERIANEGYLRTASERGSVLELALAIGYELKPGVAASTYLAFTLEDAPGTPGYAIINTGVKVMSVPGQNEKPQTFETIENLEARAAWNELKPRLTELKIPEFGSIEVYLKGTLTGLKPGDGLLFVGKEREKDPGSERWDFRIVKTITADITAGYTHVTWEEGLGWQRFNRKILPAKEKVQVYAFRLRTFLFGHNAPDWLAMPISIKNAYLSLPSNTPQVPAEANQWPNFSISAIGARRGLYAEYFDNIDLTDRKVMRVDPEVNFDWASDSPDPAIGKDNFSVRWTGFVQPKSTGKYTFYTKSDDGVRLWVNNKQIINNWTDHCDTENSGSISLREGKAYDIKLECYEHSGVAKIQLYWSFQNQKEIIPQSQLYPPDIYLDASYPQILQGSWLLLFIPEYQELYHVDNIVEDSRANFTLTLKTSRATLSGENLSLFNNKLRETAIFAQSEQLEITEAPRTDLLSGSVIELDSLVSGLEKGKLLIINGKRKNALITQDAAGLELISKDGERKISLRPADVLQVLEPPAKIGDNELWELMDRNGFEGLVIAPVGSIQMEPAVSQDPVISEVAVLDGIFESALPKRLKVVDEAFNGDASQAAKSGLEGTNTGKAFENGYYQLVGWNGESYVALGGQVNKLVRLVLEQDAGEIKVLNEGEEWDIGGGWRLAAQREILKAHGKSSKTKVHLTIKKDGIIKNKDVYEGSVYTYVEESIAGETDVPLFVTYISQSSEGTNTKTIHLKHTWAVGTDVTQINVENKFALPENTSCTKERTILVLEKAMQNSYDPFTVKIYANVARATHGETVHEVLGSGNGAQANQRFTLKKQPVTYISASTPSGTESTVEVRVNDVKWQEMPSLYGLNERVRGFIARTDDDGRTMLTFGDGNSGARLPTGQENVVATYRTGIGKQGLVKAEQLSLLMTRPLGVKGVINPLAPAGAEDPETRDQARQNAPQKVLTLDRIISLQDFEDFTRAFAGIGKAQATWLWDGEVRFVHVTVASSSAGNVEKISELYKVDDTSELYKNLCLGIESAKDPVQQFRIESFKPLFFNLSASVLVDSRYIKEKILAAVTDALKQAFTFEPRSFGQSVTESEVLAVIQRVEGVKAVDLNALYMKGELSDIKTYLKADRAHQDNGLISPAELLTLNLDGIELTEMKL